MDEKILSLKNFGIIHRNTSKGKGFGRSAKDEELSKDYKLSNVSFDLYRGNRLGITGSSGGGKSLLITSLSIEADCKLNLALYEVFLVVVRPRCVAN